MDLKIFPPNELYTVLRALRCVASANDAFTPSERDFVVSIARMHEADVDVDALERCRSSACRRCESRRRHDEAAAGQIPGT